MVHKVRKMEQGIYIYRGSEKSFSGVEKKINAQIKVLSQCFAVGKVIIRKEPTNIIKSISWRLPFGSWGARYDDAIKEIEEKNTDKNIKFFYIRGNASDRRYLLFFKTLKSKYPNSKIILELATYPYSNDLLGSKTMWPWYFKDKIYQKSISRYVDKIVTYSDDQYIFGVPTIRLKNGYDVDLVNGYLHINNSNAGNKSINLLAVANFQRTHGYERIISGLYDYYDNGGKFEIILHMVGDGTVKSFYEELVKKLNLQSRVKFYGVKSGEELNYLYSIADIALGSFGAYWGGPQVSSALKTREYLSYGIPVVSGMKEDAFENEVCEYYLEMPNDKSNIDISKIVEFYNKVYELQDKPRIRQAIHDYAKRNIDIFDTMKPVCDYILS